MMLMCAFGASIGGIGTPIGTPPNLIGIGMLNRIAGVEITFFQLDAARRADRRAAVRVPGRLLLLPLAARAEPRHRPRRARSRRSCGGSGRCRAGSATTLVAFGVTVALWLLPGRPGDRRRRARPAFARAYTAAVPESVAAMVGAILLFVLPLHWRARQFTLTWEEAVRIDWGIILLFGGGLAMGELAFSTGLAEAMGRGITSVAAGRSRSWR